MIVDKLGISSDKIGSKLKAIKEYFGQIENDYTHIEALEVKTRDERDTINKITFISQDEYPL